MKFYRYFSLRALVSLLQMWSSMYSLVFLITFTILTIIVTCLCSFSSEMCCWVLVLFKVSALNIGLFIYSVQFY